VNCFTKSAMTALLLFTSLGVGAQATTDPSYPPGGTTTNPTDPASPSTTDRTTTDRSTTDRSTTDRSTDADRDMTTDDELQSTDSFAANRLPSTASPLWLATLAGGGVFVMLGGSLRYLRRRQSA